jgi:hypothetical protein
MATRQDHGHTAAAWTAVVIILAGIFIGALAVAILHWVLFWVGIGVIFLGLIVGKVMQMMGLGKAPVEAAAEAEADADSDAEVEAETEVGEPDRSG